MKRVIYTIAAVVALAGCSGGNPESGVAGMRGVAATQSSGTLPAALPLARAIGASIANAPDRGALLSYPDKQKAAKQEGAYTWYPTAISEAHAFKAVATGEILNWLGVAAVVEGKTIRVANCVLGVEEACSGINSVLFMTSACVFYAMWRRRSLIFLGLMALAFLTAGCRV